MNQEVSIATSETLSTDNLSAFSKSSISEAVGVMTNTHLRFIKTDSTEERPFITQCKTEAKRLLKLAKTNHLDGSLSIKNLSEAQDIVARMKGKSSWHALIKHAELLPMSKDDLIMVDQIIEQNKIGLNDGLSQYGLEPTSMDAEKLSLDDLMAIRINLNDHLNVSSMINIILPKEDGHTDMWRGRAISMLAAVLSVLKYRCETLGIGISIQSIRDAVQIGSIINMLDEDLPKNIKDSVKNYLDSIPGFNPDKGKDQSDTAMEQHGYLQMQLTKSLGFMQDFCGDVFSENGTIGAFIEQANLGKISIQLHPYHSIN